MKCMGLQSREVPVPDVDGKTGKEREKRWALHAK